MMISCKHTLVLHLTGNNEISAPSTSFLTPYLSGSELMRIHLVSIRQFHPDAPILISKKGGGAEEMEGYRSEFGIRYWLEECEYHEALMRLLRRCETEYVCILDHDTVLLSSIGPLLTCLAQGQYDLVGVEERIRVPDEILTGLWPASGGWLRFAPGYMDATFLIFNLHAFVHRWGLNGMLSASVPPLDSAWEAHYGLCEKLTRHHYLRPYHIGKYGMANLLMDGDTAVLWHLWYGSHRVRGLGTVPELPDPFEPADSVVRPVVENAERALISDYPDFDFSGRVPAWAPNCNILEERLAIEHLEQHAAAERKDRAMRDAVVRLLLRIRRWKSYGVRGFTARVLARVNRWRRRSAQ